MTEDIQNNGRYALMLFLVAFTAFFAHWYIDLADKKTNEYIKKVDVADARFSVVKTLDIKARAVSVYNATDMESIYQKKGTVQMPIASLVKIMTVLTALANFDYDEVVITQEDLNHGPDAGLAKGELWDKRELSKYVLVTSSNDGAFALSSYDNDFLNKMNERAERIGLSQPLFLNVTGLDVSQSRAGAYASAEDMNILALYALKAHPEVFKSSAQEKIQLYPISGKPQTAQNTNTAISKLPGVIFSKTGFTYLAGGNLTVVFIDPLGQTIAVTLLGSGIEERFSDMEKIVNALYNVGHEYSKK